MGGINRASQRLLKAKVYFLAEGGRIKVGTTINFDQRFKMLNGYHADQLSLIGVIDGGQPLERAIHRRLTKHRMKGEWFRDCDEVRDVIKRLILGGAAAIGFKGDIYFTPIAVTKSMKPPQLSDEQRLKLFAAAVGMLFPSDPVSGLAEHCHTSIAEVQAWLDGTRDIPFWMPAVLTCEFIKIQDEEFRNG